MELCIQWRWYIDSYVVEHERPFSGLRECCRKDDVDRCNKGYQESGDSGELEDVVDWGKRPVVLSSEHEVDEEDRDER